MDIGNAEWRKARRSAQNGACVEIAPNLLNIVAIRDSKNAAGPVLRVSRESFAASVRTLKAKQR